MYDLKVDGETVSTHTTLEDAFKARNAKVRAICRELYDNDTIDKYAMQDWCFDLDQNKNMTFYLNEGCGYSIDIVQCQHADTHIKTVPKKAKQSHTKQKPKKNLFKKGDEVWVSGYISNEDYTCRVDSQGVVEADQKTARSKVLVTIDYIDGDHKACLLVDSKLLSLK